MNQNLISVLQQQATVFIEERRLSVKIFICEIIALVLCKKEKIKPIKAHKIPCTLTFQLSRFTLHYAEDISGSLPERST